MATSPSKNGKKSSSAKSSSTTKKSAVSASKKAPAGVTRGDNSMLKEFFIDEIKDIYWAEKHLLKVLPKMNKAATSTELKNCFADHLEVTKTHVSRLEQVFGLLDKKAQAKKCEAMEGITKEGESIIEDTEAGTSTRDVGLVLAAQKVEHYEISTYGGLAQLAKTLGLQEISDLLSQTLAEEKEADETLTEVAEKRINYEAASEAE